MSTSRIERINARIIAALIIIPLLLAACGKTDPTASSSPTMTMTMTVAPPTAVPPTAVVSALPTDSPVPPSSTMAMTDAPATPTDAPAAPAKAPLALEGLGNTRTRPTDGTLMVYVPGGEFLMGSSDEEIEAQLELCSPPNEACYKEFFQGEMPQHPVRVDSFWMDQTEVTNAQFVAFLNDYSDQVENPDRLLELDRGYCKIKQDNDGKYYTSDGSADYPVVMVTWHGADSYCRWAGGRLPTEAEWEYAARGPENNLYPWGNDLPTRELAQFGASVETQVGSYPQGASWCGVYDMAGNVWEWTADWYGSYSALPQENPTGPASGGIKAIHGGGWHSSQRELRATYRLADTAPSGYNG